MQIASLEATLSDELLEGEELLWSGRPDPQRRRLVSPARIFLILGIVFLPIGVLAVIIGLALLLSGVIPPRAQAGLLGLFIPGGVFFVLGLIYLLIGLIGNFPTRNAVYAITNRRVIIVRFGRYLNVSLSQAGDYACSSYRASRWVWRSYLCRHCHISLWRLRHLPVKR